MKKFLLLFSLFFFHFSLFTCSAQNLVPNPSFEEYDTCPTNQQQIQHAIGWSAYRAMINYYNACASPISTDISVPANSGDISMLLQEMDTLVFMLIFQMLLIISGEIA